MTITPLGVPVVPDVYSSVTGSSGVIAATRASMSAARPGHSLAPSAAKSVQVRNGPATGHTAGSRTMMCCRPGSWASTGSQRSSSIAPSSTAIRASQSAAW